MRYWGIIVKLAIFVVGTVFPAYKSVVRVPAAPATLLFAAARAQAPPTVDTKAPEHALLAFWSVFADRALPRGHVPCARHVFALVNQPADAPAALCAACARVAQ